jgi:transcription-repair coupling factor (superfamily II helicase)
VAQKRLQAIFEATELGAGFQIALHDLEIRGAGNLLGAEQSGQIGTVGFDLYVKLLHDAVEGLKALAKGEAPPPSAIPAPVVIDVPLAAFIPESYVGDLNLRLSLYQRMANATAPDAAEDLERELNDRFGMPPTPVRNLLYIVRLRALAARAGVASIAREERGDGQSTLLLRAPNDAVIAADLPPSARRQIEAMDGVRIGRAQARIDMALLGAGWREALVEVLEALAGAAAVAA